MKFWSKTEMFKRWKYDGRAKWKICQKLTFWSENWFKKITIIFCEKLEKKTFQKLKSKYI